MPLKIFRDICCPFYILLLLQDNTRESSSLSFIFIIFLYSKSGSETITKSKSLSDLRGSKKILDLMLSYSFSGALVMKHPFPLLISERAAYCHSGNKHISQTPYDVCSVYKKLVRICLGK